MCALSQVTASRSLRMALLSASFGGVRHGEHVRLWNGVARQALHWQGTVGDGGGGAGRSDWDCQREQGHGEFLRKRKRWRLQVAVLSTALADAGARGGSGAAVSARPAAGLTCVLATTSCRTVAGHAARSPDGPR
jgi:hypothetical protein